jgi:hypothetical protein
MLECVEAADEAAMAGLEYIMMLSDNSTKNG